MKKFEPITYTINIDLAPQGGLIVSVPEIDAAVTIESNKRDDAVEAAHQLILAYHLKMREQETAQAS
jgi:hypothetical protein